MSQATVDTLHFDPLDSSRLYANAVRPKSKAYGLYSGFRKSNGQWDWQNIGKHPHFAVTAFQGKTVLFAIAGKDAIIASHDKGTTWTPSITLAETVDYHPLPWLVDDAEIRFGPMTASDGKLYITTYSDTNKKGGAVLRGTLQTDFTLSWEDITGNFFYPRAYSAEVIETAQASYLYISTMGSGIWRLRL